MEAIVSLAVYAPCGPPATRPISWPGWTPDWLATVYGGERGREAVATARSLLRLSPT